jgi:hypothetical protein
VVERVDERLLLRHLKIFPHPTYDAHVLGYIKAFQDRCSVFQKPRVDTTLRAFFYLDMENQASTIRRTYFSALHERAKWLIC